MLKNGILKTLYISGYHPEIAKKSSEVIAFLIPAIRPDTIDKLLDESFKYGVDKAGVLCSCLRQSSSSMSNDLILSLF